MPCTDRPDGWVMGVADRWHRTRKRDKLGM